MQLDKGERRASHVGTEDLDSARTALFARATFTETRIGLQAYRAIGQPYNLKTIHVPDALSAPITYTETGPMAISGGIRR